MAITELVFLETFILRTKKCVSKLQNEEQKYMLRFLIYLYEAKQLYKSFTSVYDLVGRLVIDELQKWKQLKVSKKCRQITNDRPEYFFIDQL